MQNPYISFFSKLTGFLRLCFSLERRTPVVDAGPTREHHFFHPGCVIGTRMQSALQATARILWWSCWCFNVGYTRRSDGKSRIKWDLNFHLKKKWPSHRRFSHPPERGWVFSAINYLDFFLHEWRLRNMQSHRSKWSIRSDCGMDMDMATRCSKHVAVASTKEGIVFHASIFQVLFSSILVTQL